MHILIADDDPIALELLRNLLESEGFAVTTARDGREALDLFAQGSYRLVVTDWEMPQLNGLELCRAIRDRSDHGYVYLVLLTSHGDCEELVEGMSAGADDFIVKPFKPAELLVRVRAGVRILSLETREMVIFAMAKLAESRDPETGKHLERVQSYARVLCLQLARSSKYRDQIDPEFIRYVYQTSPLHDIGKVGIPDSVLLKPGRLTDDQFEIMKQHTVLGARTLDAALQQHPGAKFLQVARDIALSHHERFDGRGYPQGLAGEDIPLAARIVALADVYDALTSRRVYKAAFNHTLARDIIVEESGTHFDPELVAAFLAAETEFLRIRESLSEETPAAPDVPADVPADIPTLAPA
jgi:putative two-component system response regulator